MPAMPMVVHAPGPLRVNALPKPGTVLAMTRGPGRV